MTQLPHGVVRGRSDLQGRIQTLRRAGHRIALVPTMGDLHDGHLSLVRTARDHGVVLVSIFVNPTQFAAGEDFDSYPRHLEADLAALAEVGGVELVYAPAVGDVYPDGDQTTIDVGEVAVPLCGQHRPGHFGGVCRVVAKLFGLVQPDVAVFGQKDAQQCLVLQRMVQDLCMPVELVFAPTVREPDGLARSSRNRYLDDTQRESALAVHRALQAGREALAGGERQRSRIEAVMRKELAELRVDYAEVRTVPDLSTSDDIGGRVLLAVAAHVGRARLIDNLCLDVDTNSVVEAPLVGSGKPRANQSEEGSA